MPAGKKKAHKHHDDPVNLIPKITATAVAIHAAAYAIYIMFLLLRYNHVATLWCLNCLITVICMNIKWCPFGNPS